MLTYDVCYTYVGGGQRDRFRNMALGELMKWLGLVLMCAVQVSVGVCFALAWKDRDWKWVWAFGISAVGYGWCIAQVAAS